MSLKGVDSIKIDKEILNSDGDNEDHEELKLVDLQPNKPRKWSLLKQSVAINVSKVLLSFLV